MTLDYGEPEVGPGTPPKITTVQGDTTVYGLLHRVEGDGSRALLMTREGDHLSVELPEPLAVELGSPGRLRTEIGIEGTATWRVDTWEIVEFQARRITAYEPHKTNLVRTFEALAEAAGDRWEGVDVERFVAKLRGRA
jgi:hypothetical protein